MDIFVDYLPLGDEEGAPYETVQQDFFYAPENTPALVGATRGGKTVTGAGKNVSNTLQYQTNGLVVGPRWDQVRGILVEEYLKIIPKGLIWPTADGGLYHETQKIIRLLDLRALEQGRKEPGPVIYFKSGEDPKAIYGFTCGTVHLDEAPQMAEEVFGASVERCSQKPNQLFATFTPKAGRQNWANKKWALGYMEQVVGKWSEKFRCRVASDPALVKGYRFINPDPQSPSWLMEYTDNYELSRRWREMQETNLGLDTLYGQQELLGRVVDYAGLVFDMFDPKVHVQILPEEFTRVAGGIDRAALGGTTAIKVGGLTPSGRVYSFFEWGKKQATLEEIAEVCAALQVDPRCAGRGLRFYMDPNPQGEFEIATLVAHGVPVDRALKKDMMDASIRLMWERMRLRADGFPGYFIHPRCPQTIAQYQSWSFREGRSGGGVISYEDVERHGKDYIDAERYMMVGLLAGQGQGERTIIWTKPRALVGAGRW
jgi:hypothetical protein